MGDARLQASGWRRTRARGARRWWPTPARAARRWCPRATSSGPPGAAARPRRACSTARAPRCWACWRRSGRRASRAPSRRAAAPRPPTLSPFQRPFPLPSARASRCWAGQRPAGMLGAVRTRPVPYPRPSSSRQQGRRAAGRAGGLLGGAQTGRAPGAPPGRGAESRLGAVCRRALARPGAPPAGLLRPVRHVWSQGPALLAGRSGTGLRVPLWSADRRARARQEDMRLFLQLKAGRTATADDLLRALLARLPLPPANGSSIAVRAAPLPHRTCLTGVPCAPCCIRSAASSDLAEGCALATRAVCMAGMNDSRSGDATCAACSLVCW